MALSISSMGDSQRYKIIANPASGGGNGGRVRVDAIFMETKTLADGDPAFIDHTKCADPFSNDNGCTLCIKYCPFSYADYDKLKVKFKSAH